jgi:hypothetical protein
MEMMDGSQQPEPSQCDVKVEEDADDDPSCAEEEEDIKVNLVVTATYWWCKDCNVKQKFGIGESLQEHLNTSHTIHSITSPHPNSRSEDAMCGNAGASVSENLPSQSSASSSLQQVKATSRSQSRSEKATMCDDASASGSKNLCSMENDVTREVVRGTENGPQSSKAAANAMPASARTSTKHLLMSASTPTPSSLSTSVCQDLAGTDLKPIPVMMAMPLISPSSLSSSSSSVIQSSSLSSSSSSSLSSVSPPSVRKTGLNLKRGRKQLVPRKANLSGIVHLRKANKKNANDLPCHIPMYSNQQSISGSATHRSSVRCGVQLKMLSSQTVTLLDKTQGISASQLKTETFEKSARPRSQVLGVGMKRKLSQREVDVAPAGRNGDAVNSESGSKKSRLALGASGQETHTSPLNTHQSLSGRVIKKPERYVDTSLEDESDAENTAEDDGVSDGDCAAEPIISACTDSSSASSAAFSPTSKGGRIVFAKTKSQTLNLKADAGIKSKVAHRVLPVSAAASTEATDKNIPPETQTLATEKEFLIEKEEEKVKNPKLFSCEDCHRSFHTELKLVRHQQMYADQTKQQCSVCNMTLHNLDLLNVHLFHVHKTQEATSCWTCGIHTGAKLELVKHVLSHRKLEGMTARQMVRDACRTHTCTDCGEAVVIGEGRVEKHYAAHQLGRACCVCPVCNLAFNRKKKMYAHLHTHRPDKGKVILSDNRKERRAASTQDGNTNTKEAWTGLSNSFQPVDLSDMPCTRVSVSSELSAQFQASLQSVKILPSDSPMCKCDLCDAEFLSWEKLVEHQRLVDDPTTLFQCSSCQGRFHTLDVLNIHHVFVHGKTPADCFTCKKGFEQKQYFLDHLSSCPSAHPRSYQLEKKVLMRQACWEVERGKCKALIWNYPSKIASHHKQHNPATFLCTVAGCASTFR